MKEMKFLDLSIVDIDGTLQTIHDQRPIQVRSPRAIKDMDAELDVAFNRRVQDFALLSKRLGIGQCLCTLDHPDLSPDENHLPTVGFGSWFTEDGH